MTGLEKSREARAILDAAVGHEPFFGAAIDDLFTALRRPHLAPYAHSHVSLHAIALTDGMFVFPA